VSSSTDETEGKLTRGRALESLKLDKRLPEAKFENLRVAAKGQKSVYSMFKKPSSDNRDSNFPVVHRNSLTNKGGMRGRNNQMNKT
jgi:hypothetical protein